MSEKVQIRNTTRYNDSYYVSDISYRPFICKRVTQLLKAEAGDVLEFSRRPTKGSKQFNLFFYYPGQDPILYYLPHEKVDDARGMFTFMEELLLRLGCTDRVYVRKVTQRKTDTNEKTSTN